MGGNAPFPTRAAQVKSSTSKVKRYWTAEVKRLAKEYSVAAENEEETKNKMMQARIARSSRFDRAPESKRAGCGPVGAGPNLPAAHTAPSCFGPSRGCVWPQWRFRNGVWVRE